VNVPVTLSIGVSCIDITAPTAERMLDDADFALYQVKHEGRDGVAVRSQDSSLASQSPSSESA
jgi:PleD family two-component response regulator